MTDPSARPRPQYGEYATPEEQLARVRTPLPAPQPTAAETVSPSTSDAPRRRAAPVDVIVTVLLLSYGFVNVLSQAFLSIDFDAFTTAFFETMRIDARLADPTGAQAWAISAVVLTAVAWILTAVLCVRRLIRGRSAWWIALLAGVVVQLIAASLMMVPFLSDPGVRAAILATAQ